MRLIITDKYWEFDSVELVQTTDGDTLAVKTRVDTGFYHDGGGFAEIRLLGIDCPESRSTSKAEKAHGLEAKAFVDNLVRSVGIGLLRSHYRRTFARWVGEIWLKDGRYLADVIREAGYEKRASYPVLK